MNTLALVAKAAIAVLLLAAGGAKFADLDGFAVAIRLFVPGRVPALVAGVPIAAVAIAAAELLAGSVSLCWPAVGWANAFVLALACGFVVVAAVGYVRHRGQPCRCFGALTRRGFSARSVLQALLIAAAAVLAARPAGAAQVDLGLPAHLLLLAAGAMMAVAAGTAARALMAAGVMAGTEA
jgi:hypothetical protein